MNLFFWKRHPEVTGQGFRTQLAAVAQELRMQIGELPEGPLRATLLSEVGEVESAYQYDLRQMNRLQHLKPRPH
jgi:hypothetical protein